MKKFLCLLLAVMLLSLCACNTNEKTDAVNGSEESEHTTGTEITTEDIPDTDEEIYALAKQCMDKGNYDDAIMYFTALNTYEDSVALNMECKYLKAQECIENGQYWDAMIALSTLGNYKQSADLRIECEYQIAITEFESGDAVDAYLSFCRLGDYKDSANYSVSASEGIEAELYEAGKGYYSNGGYQAALYCFIGAKTYEDATTFVEYCNVMLAYQGVYKSTLAKNQYYVLDGNKLIEYSFKDEKEGKATADEDVIFLSQYEGNYCLIADTYIDDVDMASAWYVMSEEDGNRCITKIYSFDKKNTITFKDSTAFTKEELESRLEKSQSIPVPSIGMTTEEVLASTWGEPEKINRTTFSWGTFEQWVYEGHRYIYLDNGIVTAIQE